MASFHKQMGNTHYSNSEVVLHASWLLLTLATCKPTYCLQLHCEDRAQLAFEATIGQSPPTGPSWHSTVVNTNSVTIAEALELREGTFKQTMRLCHVLFDGWLAASYLLSEQITAGVKISWLS